MIGHAQDLGLAAAIVQVIEGPTWTLTECQDAKSAAALHGKMLKAGFHVQVQKPRKKFARISRHDSSSEDEALRTVVIPNAIAARSSGSICGVFGSSSEDEGLRTVVIPNVGGGQLFLASAGKAVKRPRTPRVWALRNVRQKKLLTKDQQNGTNGNRSYTITIGTVPAVQVIRSGQKSATKGGTLDGTAMMVIGQRAMPTMRTTKIGRGHRMSQPKTAKNGKNGQRMQKLQKQRTNESIIVHVLALILHATGREDSAACGKDGPISSIVVYASCALRWSQRLAAAGWMGVAPSQSRDATLHVRAFRSVVLLVSNFFLGTGIGDFRSYSLRVLEFGRDLCPTNLRVGS